MAIGEWVLQSACRQAMAWRAEGLAPLADNPGIEIEQQRSFLRANDCDEMQGYLFSRPLPPDEVAALLRAQA